MINYSTLVEIFNFFPILALAFHSANPCRLCDVRPKHSLPPLWPLVCSSLTGRQSGRGCFMKTRSRFDFHSGHQKNAFIPSPLPFDTQANRGIYSPHLEFRPLSAVATGVANGAIEVKDFQREGLARSRSLKQTRLCLTPVRRLHAAGNTGAIAFPVQNGRLESNSFRAWESGSPLPSGKRNFPTQPDLPVLQLDHGTKEQSQFDFSDIPCFKALRHGKDFNAIRRGQ